MRLVLAVCLLMTACSAPEQPLALPEVMPGGWKRTSVQPLVPAQAPGRVSVMGFKAGLAGRYEGPAVVDVEVIEMNNSTDAFSAQQSWRPDGQRMIARKNQYFITARSASPDRTMLGDFLMALEKLL